jgi:hypothetical protein
MKAAEIEAKSASLQMKIWKESIAASNKSENISASVLLLPAACLTVGRAGRRIKVATRLLK